MPLRSTVVNSLLVIGGPKDRQDRALHHLSDRHEDSSCGRLESIVVKGGLRLGRKRFAHHTDELTKDAKDGKRPELIDASLYLAKRHSKQGTSADHVRATKAVLLHYDMDIIHQQILLVHQTEHAKSLCTAVRALHDEGPDSDAGRYAIQNLQAISKLTRDHAAVAADAILLRHGHVSNLNADEYVAGIVRVVIDTWVQILLEEGPVSEKDNQQKLHAKACLKTYVEGSDHTTRQGSAAQAIAMMALILKHYKPSNHESTTQYHLQNPADRDRVAQLFELADRSGDTEVQQHARDFYYERATPPSYESLNDHHALHGYRGRISQQHFARREDLQGTRQS